MLSPDKQTLVLTWIIRRPKWLPDWNYWAAIPLVLLFAIALIGPLFPLSQPCGHQSATEPCYTTEQVVGPVSAEKRMADYTAALAVFTAALVGVAVVEIIYLARSARVAERQTALTAKQADILERQQGLANAQYFAANRPKVVLKEVYFDVPGDFSRISYELSNTGGSTAIGKWRLCWVWLR